MLLDIIERNSILTYFRDIWMIIYLFNLQNVKKTLLKITFFYKKKSLYIKSIKN